MDGRNAPVSPYLMRPLRSLAEAEAEMEVAAEHVQAVRRARSPAAPAPAAGAPARQDGPAG